MLIYTSKDYFLNSRIKIIPFFTWLLTYFSGCAKKPTGNCFPQLWRFFWFLLSYAIPPCFHEFLPQPWDRRANVVTSAETKQVLSITRLVWRVHFLKSADWFEKKIVKMSADNELSAILNRRQNLNDGLKVAQRSAKVSVYTEFSEFSRKQIKEYETQFKTWVLFDIFIYRHIYRGNRTLGWP